VTYWNISLTSMAPPVKVVLPLDKATSLKLGGAPRTSRILTDAIVMCTALVQTTPPSPHGMFFVAIENDPADVVSVVLTRK